MGCESERPAQAHPGGQELSWTTNVTPSIPCSIPPSPPGAASISSLGSRAPAPRHTALVPAMLQPGVSSQGCQSNRRNTTNSNNTQQTVGKHSPLIFSPVRFVLFPLSHKEAAAIGREQQYYSSVQPAPSQQELLCRAAALPGMLLLLGRSLAQLS